MHMENYNSYQLYVCMSLLCITLTYKCNCCRFSLVVVGFCFVLFCFVVFVFVFVISRLVNTPNSSTSTAYTTPYTEWPSPEERE